MVVKNVFVGLNRWGELAEVGQLDSALSFFSVFISLVSLRIIIFTALLAILGISLPVFKNPLVSQWLQNQSLVKTSRCESPRKFYFIAPPPFFYPSYVSSCAVFLLSLLDNLSCVQFSARFPHSCAHRT